MINGAHSIIYATDAEAARAFLRDTLGLSNVDAGGGWLIFKSPPAEVAVHPTDPAESGRVEFYLMCDDLEATMADLAAKGVEFTGGVSDQGFGRLTSLKVPGAGEVGLYEPHHPTAYDLA
jgi:catechol 2,3-dioxygenase-like lactoylglutathione lyase family enzyme